MEVTSWEEGRKLLLTLLPVSVPSGLEPPLFSWTLGDGTPAPSTFDPRVKRGIPTLPFHFPGQQEIGGLSRELGILVASWWWW